MFRQLNDYWDSISDTNPQSTFINMGAGANIFGNSHNIYFFYTLVLINIAFGVVQRRAESIYEIQMTKICKK